MTGTHEFKIAIHLAPEDPSKCIVDLKYLLMKSGRNGYVSNSSWSCEAKDGIPKELIKEILLASCDWLNNYAQKDMGILHENNAVASGDSGK